VSDYFEGIKGRDTKAGETHPTLGSDRGLNQRAEAREVANNWNAMLLGRHNLEKIREELEAMKPSQPQTNPSTREPKRLQLTLSQRGREDTLRDAVDYLIAHALPGLSKRRWELHLSIEMTELIE